MLRSDSNIIVGFEGSTLFSKGYTGIPFYIKKLVEGFAEDGLFTPTLLLPIKRIGKHKNLAPFTKNISKKWYWNTSTFGSFSKLQIIHFTHAPFINIKGVKKVATIHDLAFMVTELKDIKIANPHFVEKRIQLLSEIARHADAIISVSQKTKEDFLTYFDYPEEKIHVVPLAPIFNSKLLNNSSTKKQKPYLLNVGGISTRKNSLNILKGFIDSEASKTHTLVFAGKHGLGSDEFNAFYQNNNLEDNVTIMGYVSDKTLQSLYQNASGFIFPTLYEGFGIPILEAMNHKLPTLVGSLGAAPEVAGGHAYITNPLDPFDIAKGIDALLEFNQTEIEAAYAYAQAFSWKKTAELTAKVYTSLL